MLMQKQRNSIPASIFLFFIISLFACDVVVASSPPSNWKASSKLKKAWKNRELVYASQAIDGFCSDAVVVLGNFGRREGAISVIQPRVAFAIGDGTLLVTAAHCVGDLYDDEQQAVSHEVIVVSPYYGDIFTFEVVAVDKKADLAILKAPWDGHPALELGSEEDLDAAKEIIAAGYPPPVLKNSPEKVHTKEPIKLSRKVWSEKMGFRRRKGKKTKYAIVLDSTRFIGPGWSGSAMVLPETGKVVGVVCNLFIKHGRAGIKIFGMPLFQGKGVMTTREASGCSIRSIRDLLKRHGLEAAADRKPVEFKPVKNAKHAFSTALKYIEAHLNRKFDTSLTIAQKLVDLRGESPQIRLLLAESAYYCYTADSSKKELRDTAEINFKEALRLDPNSAHSHAMYANYLLHIKRNDESLAETAAALANDPNNQLAMVTQMRLLTNSETEKAEKLGARLTAKYPNMAHYWFSYSSVLSTLERYEESLEAAEKAVKLRPDGKYQGRLGQALLRVDRYDEAEKNIKLMTKNCGCQRCWWRYGHFLVKHRPEKLKEAEKAIKTAESKKSRRVSREILNSTKLEILEKKSPKEAESFCRKLLDEFPENADYWYRLAGILRTLEKYNEAAEAIVKAVELDEGVRYKPRLANILGKVGDLEAAEEVYDEILGAHPERARYWFWYARFLNDYYPERGEEARGALLKASRPGGRWEVPAQELKELRDKIFPDGEDIAVSNEVVTAR